MNFYVKIPKFAIILLQRLKNFPRTAILFIYEGEK